MALQLEAYISCHLSAAGTPGALMTGRLYLLWSPSHVHPPTPDHGDSDRLRSTVRGSTTDQSIKID